MNIIKGKVGAFIAAAVARIWGTGMGKTEITEPFLPPRPAPKPHIPIDLAVRFPVKRRPSRNDPNAIIRAAKRRERRSITRARNIVRGWIGTYKTPPESIRHLATAQPS